MSGRGRGRGRGGSNKSFTKEQLSSLGGGASDIIPGPVTQPPPVYPFLERKPLPILSSPEMDYLLNLRQGFIEHMQLSPVYLKMPISREKMPEQTIEKLVAQISGVKEKFDWKILPTELRPKVTARKIERKVIKNVDIVQRLEQLEQLEKTKQTTTSPKREVEETEQDDILETQEEEDEEMDDGTDYANNYFDNGEAYEDEDDTMDDGPIY